MSLWSVSLALGILILMLLSRLVWSGSLLANTCVSLALMILLEEKAFVRVLAALLKAALLNAAPPNNAAPLNGHDELPTVASLSF